MFNIIEKFMRNLKIEQLDSFARKNNVYLNSEELNYTYRFVMNNWQAIIHNPNILDLNKYKKNFSEENFFKINNLFISYKAKYQNFL